MSDFLRDKLLFEQPDIPLLAVTLYGEARGETAVGKRAVAWVIRNRMKAAKKWQEKQGRQHPLFGDGTVAGVVLRPWQFSCWNKGDPNLPKLLDIIQSDGETAGAGMWAILKAVATGVLAEPPEWPDPTWGATHYCTLNLWGADAPRAWYGAQEIESGRTKELVTLGNHVFARVA
ncbi:MAG TPA: cell wall hydrolase [Streptosporangiaceae bacterium]